jgi:hypothetical protein
MNQYFCARSRQVYLAHSMVYDSPENIYFQRYCDVIDRASGYHFRTCRLGLYSMEKQWDQGEDPHPQPLSQGGRGVGGES